jgi:DNA-binding ferritin-like protein
VHFARNDGIEKADAMTTTEQQYMELLNRKCAEFCKILTLTQQEHFTGEAENFEDESERFANLYEKREEIALRIQNIDDALSAEEYDDLVEDSENPAHQQVVERIKSVVAAIIELDEKNMVTSEKIAGFAKGNLKQIRNGRGTSSKYTDVYETTSGFLFDKKH